MISVIVMFRLFSVRWWHQHILWSVPHNSCKINNYKYKYSAIKNYDSNYNERSERGMKCYLLSSTFSVTANAWVALLSFWIITSIESWTATSNGPVGLVVETLLTAAESPLPVLFEVDKDGRRCINSAGNAFKKLNNVLHFGVKGITDSKFYTGKNIKICTWDSLRFSLKRNNGSAFRKWCTGIGAPLTWFS